MDKANGKPDTTPVPTAQHTTYPPSGEAGQLPAAPPFNPPLIGSSYDGLRPTQEGQHGSTASAVLHSGAAMAVPSYETHEDALRDQHILNLEQRIVFFQAAQRGIQGIEAAMRRSINIAREQAAIIASLFVNHPEATEAISDEQLTAVQAAIDSVIRWDDQSLNTVEPRLREAIARHNQAWAEANRLKDSFDGLNAMIVENTTPLPPVDFTPPGVDFFLRLINEVLGRNNHNNGNNSDSGASTSHNAIDDVHAAHNGADGGGASNADNSIAGNSIAGNSIAGKSIADADAHDNDNNNNNAD